MFDIVKAYISIYLALMFYLLTLNHFKNTPMIIVDSIAILIAILTYNILRYFSYVYRFNLMEFKGRHLKYGYLLGELLDTKINTHEIVKEKKYTKDVFYLDDYDTFVTIYMTKSNVTFLPFKINAENITVIYNENKLIRIDL